MDKGNEHLHHEGRILREHIIIARQLGAGLVVGLAALFLVLRFRQQVQQGILYQLLLPALFGRCLAAFGADGERLLRGELIQWRFHPGRIARLFLLFLAGVGGLRVLRRGACADLRHSLGIFGHLLPPPISKNKKAPGAFQR